MFEYRYLDDNNYFYASSDIDLFLENGNMTEIKEHPDDNIIKCESFFSSVVAGGGVDEVYLYQAVLLIEKADDRTGLYSVIHYDYQNDEAISVNFYDYQLVAKEEYEKRCAILEVFILSIAESIKEVIHRNDAIIKDK